MSVEQGAWPDRSRYVHLVQVPGNFADEELRAATLTPSRRGGPRVWSGARAMVFQAQTADRRLLAVRVLLNAQGADPSRYAALSQHLEQRSVPAFVWTRWVDEGLVSGDHRVPLIKMQWVDGIPLDDYLGTCLGNDRPGPTLEHMAEEWRRACQTLSSSDLAHGDIHAQNVLVCPGAAPGHVRYQLVDYDGVWVPSLGTPPTEVGHAAYQHPAHDVSHWGRNVDAFPTTLVYLSLRALAAEPGLWDRFHTDDTLLFQSSDLADARSADVWGALAASPESFVRSLTAVVIGWLDDRPDALPSLEDAVAAASRSRGRPSPTDERNAGEPNTWPPSTGLTMAPGRQTWGPPPTEGRSPVPQPAAAASGPPTKPQQWPGAPPPGAPATGPGAGHETDLLWLGVLAVVVAVLLVLVLIGLAA